LDILKKVNLIGWLVTLKYAYGITTSRSNAVTNVSIFKCTGLSNPSSMANSLLKINRTAKKIIVDPTKVMNDVETIFPFSFSLEKNLKKAVSKPKVRKAIK